MIRVHNLDVSLDFFVNKLGLKELRRKSNEAGRYTLVFLGCEESGPEIELTFNWDEKTPYSIGRNFGHLAFEVDNIYSFCENLKKKGVEILRPPRDGYMAFIKSPDGISIELLQKNGPLPITEPWKSTPNKGTW